MLLDSFTIHHFHPGGLFLCQEKYATDLLINAGMADCAPMPTPLPLKLDNLPGQDEPFSDPTYFRSLAGKLQYLTLTRPDIQFAVNFVCQKMHSPTVSDFNLLKRILRYLKGTLQMGLNLNKNSDSTLRIYSDSDWAGCKDTRRSTGGFCSYLGTNLISWSAKRHPTVSKSSTEAEYRTMSLAASEVAWLSSLLREVCIPQPITPEMYCDNLSAVYLTANPGFHAKTKHFEVDYHYVRERVALGALVVKHVPASVQLADIFTKSLPQQAFFYLRFKLGVCFAPDTSLRGCMSQESPSQQIQETPRQQECLSSVKTESLTNSVKTEKVTVVPNMKLPSVLSTMPTTSTKLPETLLLCKNKSPVVLHNQFGALQMIDVSC